MKIFIYYINNYIIIYITSLIGAGSLLTAMLTVCRFSELNLIVVGCDTEEGHTTVLFSRKGICKIAIGPMSDIIRSTFTNNCGTDVLDSTICAFRNKLYEDGHEIEEIPMLEMKTRSSAILQMYAQPPCRRQP